MKVCPECGKELYSTNAEFCPHCGKHLGEKTGRFILPEWFWITLIGTVGVILFSVLNWVTVRLPANVAFDNEHIEIGFSLFSSYSWLYYIGSAFTTHGVAMPVLTAVSQFTAVLLALMIVAMILLVIALIKYRSKVRNLFAYTGFGLAALVAIVFVGGVLKFNGAMKEYTGGALTEPIGTTIFSYFGIAVAVLTLVVLILSKKKIWTTMVVQRGLILMTVPILLYKVLFSYGPIYGWATAFQKYKPGIHSILTGQEWVGFANFVKLFTDPVIGPRFLLAVRNTVAQSLLVLIFSTVFAIVLALMLNEIKNIAFKRIVQNITYMPHFLSWVIVTGLVSVALSLPSSGGFINTALVAMHMIDEPILFLADADKFWGIVVGSNLWKEIGWNTILYTAAIASVDPTLYEAAEIDGAGRYRKIWNVTLPGIKSTIVILLVMNTGYIMSTGFEIPWFLGNGLLQSKAETIDVFVLKYGFQLGNYSLAVVAGIFKTIVAVVVVGLANFVAGKLGEETLI